ncbi:glycoside hydrolase family protein, partial [Ralstonia pseudosolanacearum]
MLGISSRGHTCAQANHTQEVAYLAINKGIVASIVGAAAVSIALFTASYEGERNKVYVDPVGHYAVCSGRDSYGPEGTPLKLGQAFTDDQCSVMLGKDVKTAGQALDRLVTAALPATMAAHTIRCVRWWRLWTNTKYTAFRAANTTGHGARQTVSCGACREEESA